jgi:kynureninase
MVEGLVPYKNLIMELTKKYADQLDKEDVLSSFRKKFIIPEQDGVQRTYFLGNSLGLQPKTTAHAIDYILHQWGNEGVESFFKGERPWMELHDHLVGPLAVIAGAHKQEISVMSQLTVNIHLMFVSFFNPQGKRNKMLVEAKAFPSDQYAFTSYLEHLGLNPADHLIEIQPKQQGAAIDDEDVVAAIQQHADEIALVFIGGVNYYTGQLFDLEKITKAAKSAGAMVGFDLAHAIGNVELKLHDWGVDFACWCSYKYLNGGPGAVGAIFVHDQHLKNPNLKRLAGWWGYPKEGRFKMHPQFEPAADATSWQLGTPSMILYACLKASLQIFEEAGWKAILEKQSKIKEFLDMSIQSLQSPMFTCLTPTSRGCQVSLLFHANGRQVYDRLFEKGFMVDWREPNVIRLAPVPLYNSFNDIWNFHQAMEEILSSI